MEPIDRGNYGIQLLVQKCRSQFQRPENMNFYDADDYKAAERKYVKFCLLGQLDV
jgi:hypothetical protein